jgi:hypothetical protein
MTAIERCRTSALGGHVELRRRNFAGLELLRGLPGHKVEELTGVSLRECPFCRQGQMVCIEVLAPVASQDPPFPDTS